MKFKAKVLRFHMIPDVRGKLTPSIILTDIRELTTNFLVARQQECKMGKILVSARLHRNDVVEFEALFSVDKLKNIRNIKKIPRATSNQQELLAVLKPGEQLAPLPTLNWSKQSIRRKKKSKKAGKKRR